MLDLIALSKVAMLDIFGKDYESLDKMSLYSCLEAGIQSMVETKLFLGLPVTNSFVESCLHNSIGGN